ncbi:hypothetical protein R1sor_011270 [Riccia sorocarpa]|uniref:Potassium channel SKOR n=1 Tax=Riccia sorocarpa TaxID=122646 RepID=A0ABD3I287_9MARC
MPFFSNKKRIGEGEAEYEIQDVAETLHGSLTLGKKLSKFMKDFSIKRAFKKLPSLEGVPIGKYYISPYSRRYRAWWMFLVIAAGYSSLFTPLEFGFYRGLPRDLFIADLAVQAIFLADILVHFFLAYRDPESYQLVVDFPSISDRYIKTDFILDLIGCLPWDAIYKSTGRHEFVRYFVWFRLYRARKVDSFFVKLEKDIRINYFAARIAKLLAVEFYCTHIAACFFYYLATTVPARSEKYTWIGSLSMGSYEYDNFRSIDIGKRYVTSMYWAITTMATVGYGDIHPVNTREMVFAMLYISFDMILGAYLVGNMTALIVKGSTTERFRDKMAALIKFMNRNGLPRDIRQQMKNHVRLQFETGTSNDMSVVDDLPMTIRSKVAQSLYSSILERVPLFAGCSAEFIAEIVAKVDEEHFLPGEIVIQQGGTSDQLYIVVHGVLEELVINDDGAEDVVSRLEADSICGEVGVLCNIPQPFTVRVLELCRLLRLDKDSFTHVVQIYFNDGRKVITNLLEWKETDARFGQMATDITFLVAKQQAELALMVNNAAFQGDVTQLKHLVKSGAAIDRADYDGRTALHLAASRGYDTVVQFLIREGADVNAIDKFGNSPLFEAVKGGHEATISLLLENGAKLHLQDAANFLCKAAMHGNHELLRRLVEAGVNVSVSDYDHRTALHLAASEGSFACTKLLVDSGADVFAQDRWGRTAMDEAVQHNRTNIIPLLKDAAAKRSQEVCAGEPRCTLRARKQPTETIQRTVKEPGGDHEARVSGSKDHGLSVPTQSSLPIGHRLSTEKHLERLMTTDCSQPVEPRPSTEKRTERLMTLGVAAPRRSSVSDSNEDLCARYRHLPARQVGSGRKISEEPLLALGCSPQRRCTVFPFHPWTPRNLRALGKVEWVPGTIDEIFDISFHEFGKQATKVLNQDCGEITSTDFIGDLEKIYVVDDDEVANAGSSWSSRGRLQKTGSEDVILPDT